MKHSRHTFATDMLSGGVSLPALMQLMGHSKIQTTLEYVQISALRKNSRNRQLAET
jgi:site-specific recombinase XerD